MNATSLEELRSRGRSRETVDEKMEQVRELLVGEELRRTDARLAAMETRIRELEATFERRLDALQARIDALAGETAAERRGSFDELSRLVTGLGDEIRRIGKSG
jgi:glutathione S-transferase